MAFKKKQSQQAFLKAGVYGPAGSGKTLTSLLCAEGLAKMNGKRIAFIDTEHGADFYVTDIKERKVHPKAFDFDAIDTRSITTAIKETEELDTNTHGVLIVDSISHLWDSTVNAWPDDGEIPPWAWSKIKKPYKDFMHLLIALPMHVFICGREGNRYVNDEVAGKKMRGEAEADYEPHLMLRLSPLVGDDGTVHRATVEKDRSGTLSGQVIEWPTYDNICKPLLKYLGGEQAAIPSEDAVTAVDSANMTAMEMAKSKISATNRDEFRAKFLMAKSLAELDAASAELTAGIKKMMSAADVASLRKTYQEKRVIMEGVG